MDLLAIALAPSIAIILFIVCRDRYDREPRLILFASFIFGVISTIPAMLIEAGTSYLNTGAVEGTILFAFFGVALVEELVKFVPLRLFSFNRRSFDEPLDGIIHGVMIAMGFATLENIFYVFEHGMETGWWRMFTAVPGHASWGAIMGYYAGKAKFNYAKRVPLLLTGFLLATFFHGLYDACLFLMKGVDENTAGALALGALTTHIFAVVLAARLIRQHRKLSRELYKTAPVLTIRNANVSDIPLIRTLAEQIWPLNYAKIITPKQIKYMMNLMYSEKALKQQMQSGHQLIIVYNNSIPVGFASYSEVEISVYKLHKIYLLANQRGRGTGKFTMEQVIADIQPKGASVLRLNVNRHNKAKSFYEKLGFTLVTEEKIDIGSGYFMDDFVLEKNILDSNAPMSKV